MNFLLLETQKLDEWRSKIVHKEFENVKKERALEWANYVIRDTSFRVFPISDFSDFDKSDLSYYWFEGLNIKEFKEYLELP